MGSQKDKKRMILLFSILLTFFSIHFLSVSYPFAAPYFSYPFSVFSSGADAREDVIRSVVEMLTHLNIVRKSMINHAVNRKLSANKTKTTPTG